MNAGISINGRKRPISGRIPSMKGMAGYSGGAFSFLPAPS
jgi:hypothetical protein